MKHLSKIGGVLFALGFAVATGVEQNPIQALYAVVLIGAACVCFNMFDKYEQKQKKQEKKTEKHYLHQQRHAGCSVAISQSYGCANGLSKCVTRGFEIHPNDNSKKKRL